MIDHEIRSRGVGGSEIAAIMGLDPRRDAYAVWAQKTGLLKHSEPNERMIAGKFLEQGIARWYAARTQQEVEWIDYTMHHTERTWQVYTPDALVVNTRGDWPRYLKGVDCKNVAWDQREKWGEPGTDDVPDPIHLQCQWYCSAADLPEWDVAACFGGNDLRIYTVRRDVEIETAILYEAERFWNDHVLTGEPPEPGPSPATTEALKQIYPQHKQDLRWASAEEIELLDRLRRTGIEWDDVNSRYTALENQVKVRIADSEGLYLPDGGKITWRKERDSVGPDYESIARELGSRCELLKAACDQLGWVEARPEWWVQTFDDLASSVLRVTRAGARKLIPRWNQKKKR